jgi:hypothetical protein
MFILDKKIYIISMRNALFIQDVGFEKKKKGMFFFVRDKKLNDDVK